MRKNNGQKVFGVDWNCPEPKHKALKETALAAKKAAKAVTLFISCLYCCLLYY